MELNANRHRFGRNKNRGNSPRRKRSHAIAASRANADWRLCRHLEHHRRPCTFIRKGIFRKGSLGVASPGAISNRNGLLKNSNSIVLNGKPLVRDLSQRLGRPIRLENANCFALSEAIDGAAVGAHVAFGVILGTGVGGGIVIGKELIAGHNKIAGEWGHSPLPWATESERPGTPCYCGKSGCVETFLSGATITAAPANI